MLRSSAIQPSKRPTVHGPTSRRPVPRTRRVIVPAIDTSRRCRSRHLWPGRGASLERGRPAVGARRSRRPTPVVGARRSRRPAPGYPGAGPHEPGSVVALLGGSSPITQRCRQRRPGLGAGRVRRQAAMIAGCLGSIGVGFSPAGRMRRTVRSTRALRIQDCSDEHHVVGDARRLESR